MPDSLIVTLAALLALLTFAGCQQTPEDPVVAKEGGLEPEKDAPAIGPTGEIPEPDLLDPNRVVARVNDEIITVRTIQSRVGGSLRRIEASEDELRAALDDYATRIIIDRLFLQAAKSQDVDITEDELEEDRARFEREAKERGTTLDDDLAARGIPRFEWEEERRRILIHEKFRDMALGRARPVSPETRARFDTILRPVEVRRWYDRHREDFQETEEARITGVHVLALAFDGDPDRTLEAARSVAARARRGEPLEKLGEEVGGTPLPESYDEPFGRDKELPEEVGKFTWSAPVGSISDPIRTRSGYLVLKLLRRRNARTIPFEEAREQIENRLGLVKLNIGQLKLQLDLLEEAVVTPRHLKNGIRKVLKARIGELLEELNG